MITPLEFVPDAVVLIEDGRITACGPRAVIEIPTGARLHDCGDAVLAPGFIDMHIHGAAGYDVMARSDSGLRTMGQFLARHGVTSFVPTTVTAPTDTIISALEYLGARAGSTLDDADVCAVPIGIHIEGPFLSQARRGVHPPIYIQEPNVAMFSRFWTASNGTIRVMTLAPELMGAPELIREAVRLGVRVSMGHSNAEYDAAQKAISDGVVHATHTFNAMRPMEHRAPGIAGCVLADRALTADIIVDGLHVVPPMVDIFLRCKGRELAVLISDATSATGMPDGTYRLGSFEVEVTGLRCESHGKLAGSVLTLDVAVRNVMKFANWPLADAVRLATLNPARVLGIDDRKGQLKPGYDADIVVLSKTGDVIQTIAGDRGI